MKNKYTVKRNKLGFGEVANKPTRNELESFYSKRYYQEETSQYSNKYSEKEKVFFKNNIERHYGILLKNIENTEDRSFLEIGPGEGYALDFFIKKGWNCIGIDYSDYGCKTQNPDCLENIILGDIEDTLDRFIAEEKKFKVLYVDHVLEHVLDPIATLRKIKRLLHDDGCAFIGVPNDFSKLQNFLIDKGFINREFWLKPPEHISYFNHESLDLTMKNVGLKTVDFWSSFPIDFNLFNDDTNYVRYPSKGKNCHNARVEIDNFMTSISSELTLELYRSLCRLGLGRDLNIYVKKEKG